MSSDNMASSSRSAPPLTTTAVQKRGFFGKLKDKAIGTKEEREAEKRHWAEIKEQRRQEYLAQQAARQAYYAEQQQQYGRGLYAAPAYGPPMAYRRRGLGGGTALPLLGGLAGGLLLGDLIGGGFDGGFDGGYDGGFDGGFGGGFDGGFF
jgi:hypothetical protein